MGGFDPYNAGGQASLGVLDPIPSSSSSPSSEEGRLLPPAMLTICRILKCHAADCASMCTGRQGCCLIGAIKNHGYLNRLRVAPPNAMRGAGIEPHRGPGILPRTAVIKKFQGNSPPGSHQAISRWGIWCANRRLPHLGRV